MVHGHSSWSTFALHLVKGPRLSILISWEVGPWKLDHWKRPSSMIRLHGPFVKWPLVVLECYAMMGDFKNICKNFLKTMRFMIMTNFKLQHSILNPLMEDQNFLYIKQKCFQYCSLLETALPGGVEGSLNPKALNPSPGLQPCLSQLRSRW